MAYGYKRSVAISASKVPSTQSNFPVLFHETNASFKSVANGGKIQDGTNGYDLAFYSDSALTTQLSHEIVYHNLTTGEVVAWVKIPSLSSSGTTYYVAYGDSGIGSSQENVSDVWSNSFAAVWHCNESSGNLSDSTGNGNTLTATSMTYLSTGKIKYSVLRNADSDNLLKTGAVDWSAPFTYQGWFKTSNTNAVQIIVNTNDNNTYTNRHMLACTTGAKVMIHTSAGGSTYTAATTTATYSGSTWTMAHGVVASATSRSVYLNGGNKVSDTTSATPSGVSPETTAGRHDSIDPYPLGKSGTGELEELRISTVARSDDWITTDYNTQSDPSTFYTLGSETATFTTTTKTNTGTSRIKKTQTKTKTGTSRIKKTQTKTKTGTSRIKKTQTKTTTGASRIKVTTTRTTTGTSAIAGTTTRTTEGTSRIEVTTSQTTSGTSRIVLSTEQTTSGTSRIETTSDQTTTGTSRVGIVTTKTTTGTSRVTVETSRTTTGTSRVTATTTKTTTGTSTIASAGTTSQLIISGSSASPPSSGTTYHDLMGGGALGFSNTESNRQQVIPTAGTLTNFRFRVKTAPGNGKTWTISVRKNGVTTALSQAISGASTTESALDTDEVSVSAGDLVNIIVETQANPADPGAVYWSCEFRPTTPGETILLANSGGNNWTANNYGTLISNKNPDTTETDAATLFPCSGTVKSFYLESTAAPGAGTTRTFTFRKNGTGQTLTADLSDTATTTNDTTHSFTVSAGDYVSILGTDTTGTPGTLITKWGCVFIPDNSGDFITAAVTDDSTDTSATEYAPVTSGYNVLTATEDEQYQYVSQDTYAKAMYVRLNVDPGTSPDAYTFTLRKNGVSTALAVTIVADNTTGSSVQSVAISATDVLDTMIEPVSTPSSTTRPMISYLFNNTAVTTTTKTTTGTSRITAQTSRTTSGDSRIAGTTTRTTTGTSTIVLQTSRTIGGTSRIETTSDETISGTSRVGTTSDETIGGTSRITVQSVNQQPGTSRIEVTTSQTTTGDSRIAGTTDRTIDGDSRIEVTTSRTTTGSSTIATSTSRTTSGTSRIEVTTDRTIDGTSSIYGTTDRTQEGTSRVQVTTSETIDGVSRIGITSDQTQAGTSRIQAISTRTISGTSKILVTGQTAQTTTGTSRIEVTTDETISGDSRIGTTSDETISGTSRVGITSDETISGTSRVETTSDETISGTSRVTVTTDRTTTGTSKISVTGTTAQTTTGTSRIEVTTTQTQAGTSRIKKTQTKTTTGTSRVEITTTETTTGTSRVEITTTETTTGTSRVEITTEQTTTGTSNVFGSTTRIQTGVSRIVTASAGPAVGRTIVETETDRTIEETEVLRVIIETETDRTIII